MIQVTGVNAGIARCAVPSSALAILAANVLFCQAAEIHWTHLSSKNGALPVPGSSMQQTGNLVADLDKDGTNDFVLSFRAQAPALVWYRRTATNWDRYVIEPSFLTVEAGGAACDIDGDGDLDIVFGGDWQSDEVWWWENPYPKFDPNVPWKRHLIKKGGKTQHHDQIFGDFKRTGKPQLVFWNQGAKTLFIADIPEDPRHAEPWPAKPIFSGNAGESGDKSGGFKYVEGLAAADIDGDGIPDLLAGNYWFKYLGNDKFKPIKIGTMGGRICAGKLIESARYPQVVIAPGDGTGPWGWYECVGDPLREEDWVGHDLLGRDMIHGHSLDIGDIDGDGHLDIFAAEMAKWTEKRPDPDNLRAEAWIFFGDGQGHFRKERLAVGHDFHEAKLADLDGDGRLDILNKPYNWDAPRIDVWLNKAGIPLIDPSNFVSVFSAGSEGYACYRIPALVTTLKGTLIAVADGRISNCGDIPNPLDLVCKRSFDNGRTWSPLQVIADYGKNTNDMDVYPAYGITNPVARVAAGDAALLIDRTNGRVWVLYDNGARVPTRPSKRALKLEMRYSDDDGLTWSPGIDIEAGNPGLRPAGLDFMASPGIGIQLAEGQHAGRLLFAAYVYGGPYYSTVIYSDDHGATWKRGGNAGTGGGEIQVAETGEGRLMATLRNNAFPEKGVRFFSTSPDGGETWAIPYFQTPEQTSLPDPKCQASLLRWDGWKGLGAWRPAANSGQPDGPPPLLLANAADPASRSNFTLRVSYDSGRTWLDSNLIYAGSSAYSVMTPLPSGEIGLLFELDKYHRICFVSRKLENR